MEPRAGLRRSAQVCAGLRRSARPAQIYSPRAPSNDPALTRKQTLVPLHVRVQRLQVPISRTPCSPRPESSRRPARPSSPCHPGHTLPTYPAKASLARRPRFAAPDVGEGRRELGKRSRAYRVIVDNTNAILPAEHAYGHTRTPLQAAPHLSPRTPALCVPVL